MTITIDARGLNCPAPVIKTKKAIESNPNEDFMIIVNNVGAKENVKRLGENLGYDVTVTEKTGDFFLQMSKSCCTVIKENSIINNDVIYVSTDKMGQGSDDLGKVLMKGYFYALTEVKPYPKAVLFVNSGVYLTTEGSEVLEYLRVLADHGVEILSCGTCLNFFNLSDKLAIGDVTNMYTIVEQMNQAAKVIRV
ncbi:MAG: sulfurtransferase-like selenium metabolism protein YedF [Bacillota bacterium]|jgi:selenium metabolism protein YedF|nr:sulfurtransferase-like selenium metabolism protein YedF [Clostridia bacterium]